MAEHLTDPLFLPPSPAAAAASRAGVHTPAGMPYAPRSRAGRGPSRTSPLQVHDPLFSLKAGAGALDPILAPTMLPASLQHSGFHWLLACVIPPPPPIISVATASTSNGEQCGGRGRASSHIWPGESLFPSLHACLRVSFPRENMVPQGGGAPDEAPFMQNT